jgi:putative flippase GtrA
MYLFNKNFININNLQIIRFCIVGVLTLILHLVIFYISNNYLGLGLSLSSTYAFWLTTLIHFILNRNFVFKISTNSLIKQKINYLIMIFYNYIITLIGLYIIINILKYNPYINIFFSTIMNVIFNYLWMKNFVFK